VKGSGYKHEGNNYKHEASRFKMKFYFMKVPKYYFSKIDFHPRLMGNTCLFWFS